MTSGWAQSNDRMIPLISWTTIQLGPITLHVWGMFVALGFLLGTFAATKLAKQRGEDPKVIVDLVPWLVFGAIVGGRLGMLFYEPGYYLSHLVEFLEVWKGGASMFGGLIVCAIIAVIYFKKKKVDIAKYADILAFGLPFGIWIGRIGCFLIHDHPGTLTHFILGVKFPDGTVRHDLGLDESILGLVMAIVFILLARKPRPVGTYLGLFAVMYSLVRFFLDFLRIADATYFGLTPAQYLCILLFGFGVWKLWSVHRKVAE